MPEAICVPSCVTTPAALAAASASGAHFGHVVAERLLAIDVFPCGQGRQGDRRVHVIGHGHVDGVDPVAFLRQQLAPIGVTAGIGKQRGSLIQMGTVHIADGNDFHLRVRLEVAEVHATHPPNADAGVVELFGGGKCVTAGGEGGESGSGSLEKLAA